MAFLVRSNLRQLIVILALLSTLVAVINMFIASAKVQKQALIDNTLLSNEAYASKLADSTQAFLESALLQLAYSAKNIAQNWPQKRYLNQETQRLSKQNYAFNSVLLSDANGVVLASSDNAIELHGQILTTPGPLQALKERKPLISQPYESSMDNLLVLISSPIFHENGTYLGYISGSIYLKEKNILSRLLGEHYHHDGSYIYVVDNKKRLLYHPDKERLGSAVHTNPLLDLALSGGTGAKAIVNSKGIEMLSGYAYIPAAGWGVVSQRPADATLNAHEGLMQKILLHSLPINLTMLALIWLCAWLISSPLRQLAANAKNMRQRTTIQRVERIQAWYFEANELKHAFLHGLQNVHDHVGQLRQDVRTDPLTGLNNRRALERILEKCDITQTFFSAITLDIDHFKHVNDTFGHDVGDIVLKELAFLMRSTSRDQDFCIRLGGEEFLILLPSCSLEVAADIAERLRLDVEKHEFTTVGKLTISLGVASWPQHANSTTAVLKIADEMLYAAKQGGRNQVRTAPLPKID